MTTGRQTKLTPTLQKQICDLIRKGNYRQTAAAACGLHRATFMRWLARGRKAKAGLFCDFRSAVLEAEQAAETAMVALVLKGAKKDSRHAEWWLERKLPKRWGRRETRKHEHSGPGGEPIPVEVMTDAQRLAALAALGARLDARQGSTPVNGHAGTP